MNIHSNSHTFSLLFASFHRPALCIPDASHLSLTTVPGQHDGRKFSRLHLVLVALRVTRTLRVGRTHTAIWSGAQASCALVCVFTRKRKRTGRERHASGRARVHVPVFALWGLGVAGPVERETVVQFLEVGRNFAGIIYKEMKYTVNFSQTSPDDFEILC